MRINDIDYDLSQMTTLKYVLGKANEYVDKVGWERATKSQKFIRHIQTFIALKLKELGIPDVDIRFETKLHNKNVDLCVFKNDVPFLVISIKSQSGSVKKNFTNTANSLQGEAASLKSSYPNLKVSTFILYKRVDATLGEDLSQYYLDNIPTKILPLISPDFMSNNKFDLGCLVLWEKNADGIEIEETEFLFNTFNQENFFRWVKEIYEGKEIKSQFDTSTINEKIIDFLKDDNILDF